MSQDTSSTLVGNSSMENNPVAEASFKKVIGNVSNESENGKIVTSYICGRSHYMWNCLNKGSLTALVVEE